MKHKTFAIKLSKEAGKIIREKFTLGMKKEWKENETPLTIADTIINDFVKNKIKETYPKYGFLGEEGGSFNKDAEYLWVCDPIDGTIPFSHGIPTCVFSLALVRHGKPILAVIYDPFMDRLFYAEEGQGAFLNNQPIHVSSIKTSKNACLGFIAWRVTQPNISPVFPQLINMGFKVTNVSSLIYMGALVANGEFVAAIWPGPYPWDVASLKIIVEEAGGRVTDLYGHDQLYNQDINGGVISNGIIHDQLIERIKKTIK